MNTGGVNGSGSSGPDSVENSGPQGPGHSVLLGLVARRHYLEGRSKVEIADQLGVSRFKVARLIDEARDRGIVRIEVVEDPEIDVESSARVGADLALATAIVLTPDGGGAVALDRLGEVAARLLTETLGPSDVLGLPWSRSVEAMVHRLGELPPVSVVQLCGAQPPPGGDSSAVDVVVRAARAAGTRGHVFFTPLLVSDAATASALRREPQVSRALDRAGSVTTAVVGVGAWAPGASTVYDACEEVERTALADRGVVGEIAGVTFDADGRCVDASLAQRLISVDEATLRAIPRVIALARGADRARAVRAAARGGLISGLVADAELAGALLATS